MTEFQDHYHWMPTASPRGNEGNSQDRTHWGWVFYLLLVYKITLVLFPSSVFCFFPFLQRFFLPYRQVSLCMEEGIAAKHTQGSYLVFQEVRAHQMILDKFKTTFRTPVVLLRCQQLN